MYCIHIPDRQDIEPRLRSTLESAEKERVSLNQRIGTEAAVIDLIPTVRFTQGERDE